MKIYKLDQKSDDWFQIRKGKITGTGLKRIVGSQTVRDNYFYEVLAERLATGLGEEENAMERRNRLEGEAIKAFEKETGIVSEKFGFVESDENEFMAQSPDGLIKNGKKYDEAVEVKCLSSANHVRIWLENEIPKDYYPQVIQYFIVNPDLKKVHFVSYDPRIEIHPVHIIEVDRKTVDDDITDYKTQQLEFIGRIEETLAKLIKI